MSQPKRIRLSRAKGWRMPDNAVKVDRSTVYGNPYVVGRDGTAAECVVRFRALMAGHVCLTCSAGVMEQEQARARILIHLAHLRGKDLACWCGLIEPCHADVLLALANGPVCEALP
ncbi:DUF4326 domain-containing protein [Aquabacter sp. L1I39]|uniref:DUF4326 domain-containing protein n=1 Tax=Aquabacter sp. L1I39 TaxID=2820278 RepID=UPI001ADA034F|nr:DUF4326 domain-containing protein [Aquabacter sp. L1I39]QTL01929.1 DUF4326 domain-containing protein [Aquabacter sp. L1I39]